MGRSVHISSGAALDPLKTKFKITLDSPSTTVASPACQAFVGAMLNTIRDIVVNNVAVDRGHRRGPLRRARTAGAAGAGSIRGNFDGDPAPSSAIASAADVFRFVRSSASMVANTNNQKKDESNNWPSWAWS